MKSETPYTDGHLIRVLMPSGKVKITDTVTAGFARRLELDLNAASEKYADACDIIVNLRLEIAELKGVAAMPNVPKLSHVAKNK